MDPCRNKLRDWVSQGVTAGGSVSGIIKELKKKIMEKLSNTQVQHQPVAMAVLEQQITLLEYKGRVSLALLFCTLSQSTH